jgi:deoxycytidylate deaminase
MKHIVYMQFLYHMTLPNSPVGHAKIGACIVYKKRIISYGFNQKKSHTLQAKYADNKERIYLHAEIDAVRKSLYFLKPVQLEKATIYVLRIMASLHTGLAKPCNGCHRFLNHFNIPHIYYTTHTTQIGYIENVP